MSSYNLNEVLKARAADIPAQVGQCLCLSPDDAGQLYSILYKLLGNLA